MMHHVSSGLQHILSSINGALTGRLFQQLVAGTGLSGKLMVDCCGTAVDLGQLHRAVSAKGGQEVTCYLVCDFNAYHHVMTSCIAGASTFAVCRIASTSI